MNRHSFILSLGFAILLIAPCCSKSVEDPAREKKDDNVKADGDILCVTVWPKTTRVQIDEQFEICLRVVNASEKPLSFRVFEGTWYKHWVTTNLRIQWFMWSAVSNPTKRIKLEPGEAYEKTLQVWVKDGFTPLVTTSFQMGFTPFDEKKTYWKKTYWSNKVVLGIKPDKGE